MDESYFQKLDAKGAAWVRDCLESGEALSHAMLSKANLDEGTALLAITTTEHRDAVSNDHPFNQGVLNQKVVYTDLPAGLLLKELRELEDRSGPLAVVVEDNLTSPGDPILKSHLTGRLNRFNDKFLNTKNVATIQTAKDLIGHLNQSSGHPLNAFVVPLENIPDRQEFEQSDINGMASSALAVINFAYDNETYILWLASSIEA